MADRNVAALKKLLKEWERDFHEKNGRKPSKDDVLNGPPDIQDVYKKYRLAKKGLTRCHEVVGGDQEERLEQRRPAEKNEVFGADLNKKPEVKKLLGGAAGTKSRTWKLPLLQTSAMLRPHGGSRKSNINTPPPSPPPLPPPGMDTLIGEEELLPCSVSTAAQTKLPTSADFGSPSVDSQLDRVKKLKYRGVSLSMLENCDLESAVPEQDSNRSTQVKKNARASLVKRDSFLARILDQEQVAEGDEKEDYISTANNSSQDGGSGSHGLDNNKVCVKESSPPPNSFHHNLSGGNNFSMPISCTSELPVTESPCNKLIFDKAVKQSAKNHADVVAAPDDGDHEESTDKTRQDQDLFEKHSGPQQGVSCTSNDQDGGDMVNVIDNDCDKSDGSAPDSGNEEEICEGTGKKAAKSIGGASRSSGGMAVSENFRRLNMKVKRYTRRPGRGMTGEKYKRQEWKKRQREVGGGSSGHGKSGGKFVCFKCGKTGHWARNCTNKGGFANLGAFDGEEVEYSELNEEEQLDLAALEELEKESPYPTIREALQMAAGEKVERRMTAEEVDEEEDENALCHDTLPHDVNNHLPDHLPGSDGDSPPPVEPLLKWDSRVSESTPSFVMEALQSLGFSSFRPGQKEVVMRILSGQSTLMITATGSGKSLCYQLPAYIYRQRGHGPCITLVVSPLVSLMDDQVLRLPPGLKGACLHTNKTQLQKDKVFQELARGKLDILFLSPEALVGGVLWNRKRDIPPIMFACIDEVHCVSEWSHNFRPSYLRLYKTLQSSLGVRCLLGLTATATHVTGLAVARQLGVAEENIVWGAAVPGNLHISVSRDEDRDLALVELLSREPYKSLKSIIVYCTRQQTTETVAQMLRTSLQFWNQNENEEPLHVENESSLGSQENVVKESLNYTAGTRETTRKRKASQSRGKGKKRKTSGTTIVAECYHAGMSASQRRSVQNRFMRGDLRIVVATIAFGMGLNKADVRAVLHYNMPQSMESYVQEVGRAGRDGNPAYCHAFIDQEGKDLSEMRRNIYSNSVDSYTLKKFVERVFPAPAKPCSEREVAINIESTVEALNVSKECLETLLCYLELEGKVRVLGMVKDLYTLKFYGGRRQLKALSWKVPAVAAAAASLKQKGMDLDSTKQMSFSITEVAHLMGQDSSVVRSELLGLQVNDRGTSDIPTGGRSSILVELGELAFHLVSPGNLTCEEREEAIQFLKDKIEDHEKLALEKLHLLHAVLRHTSEETQDRCVSLDQQDQSLKYHIQQYFSSNSLSTADLAQLGIPVTSNKSKVSAEEEDQIGRDVNTLVSRFSEQQFNGRAITRIFHGISSPCFPAIVWGAQGGFWRRYLHIDFHTLCHIITRKLILIQTNRRT